MTATSKLKLGQLLFEPKPPNSGNSQDPSNRRRAQSAKERRWRNVQMDRLNERPRSAVLSCEKRTSSRPPSGKFGQLVAGRNVDLNLGCGAAVGKTPSKLISSNSPPACQPIRKHGMATTPPLPDHIHNKRKTRAVPASIAALTPWLTTNVNQKLIGIDPQTCLVFLPADTNLEDLPVVPAPQRATDQLCYSRKIKEPKSFDPKKLFHYDVEKNRSWSADHACNHNRSEDVTEIQKIFGRNGTLLYDGSNYHRNRTKDVIEKEIKDLEKLLEGIGNEDGSSIIMQYQHDINQLQAAVKETLSEYDKGPTERVEETPSDLMGLRAYLKEKEKIIRRIRERREKCIEELEGLEEEFGIRVTISSNNTTTGL